MRLSLKQIEVFRAIMLAGSISGAAKMLFVSQPAVSRLISYTEQSLGLVLFERIKGKLYPTPEAHLLFDEVNLLFEKVERIQNLTDDLVHNRLGQLRIACSPNLGLNLIPHSFMSFRKKFPSIRLILNTMVPGMLEKAIISKQSEIGIAYLLEPHPMLETKVLFHNDLVVALPNGHPKADAESLHLEDLVEENVIGYGEDLPIGRLIQMAFNEHGIDILPNVEVRQIHVACAMVQAGAGIAIVDHASICGPTWGDVNFVPLTPQLRALSASYTSHMSRCLELHRNTAN